jgi:hypothetical protein
MNGNWGKRFTYDGKVIEVPEHDDCGTLGWQPDDGPPPYSAEGEELGEDSYWCRACECWFEGWS